jgi:hypothetical protein
VSTPRRQLSRATSVAHGRVGDERGHLALEALAADHQRVDRAEAIGEHRLRDRLRELDAGEPVAVRLRPVVAVKAQIVSQQQVADAVTRAHQIAAQVLARADQITQGFLARGRHPDRMQLSAINSPTRRSASRRSVLTRSCGARALLPGAAITHSTPIAASSRATPNPVGPASYLTFTGAGNARQNSTAALVDPGSRAKRNSPDRASTIAATIFDACTSKPAQLRACATSAPP